MDAFVTARVPIEIKEQGNMQLAKIGVTPTMLVNDAYEYIIRTGKLPTQSLSQTTAAHVLTQQQADVIKSRFAKTTLQVPESAWGEKTYEDIIAEGKIADYEALR